MIVPPTSPNSWPICSVPSGDAPFGEIDLRVAGEEIEDAAAVRGHAAVVEGFEIFDRDGFALLIGHRLLG